MKGTHLAGELRILRKRLPICVICAICSPKGTGRHHHLNRRGSYPRFSANSRASPRAPSLRETPVPQPTRSFDFEVHVRGEIFFLSGGHLGVERANRVAPDEFAV